MARGRRKAVTGIVGVFLAALMAAGVVLAPIVPLATLASVAPLAGKPDSPAVNLRRARIVTVPLNYSFIIDTLAEALQEHNKTAALGLLEDLKEAISNETLKNSNATEGQINALLNKIKAMIHQVNAGAFRGALNKLKNDVKDKIEKWIVCPPKDWFLTLEVWRNIEAPEYDEPVTVTANVTASNGIDVVILSYSVGENNWVNETMNLKEGLYQFTIDAQPYNITVHYKVYAIDVKGNWVSSAASYTVIDTRPPQILSVKQTPAAPNYAQTATVFANVTEPAAASGVELVVLTYWNGSVWTEIPMTLENENYKAAIPSFPWGTTVQYKIYARDYARNRIDTDLYGYTVSDSSSPNVSDVERTPTDPEYDETTVVTASVAEPVSASGVKTVILSYFDGSKWINVTMASGSDWYTATIPELPYATSVQYKIYAFDNAGNFRVTDVRSYIVTDKTVPEIGIINWSPEEPNATEEVNVNVSVSEPAYASGVKNVTLWYSANGGEWAFAQMTLKDGNWTAKIPSFEGGTNVEFYVDAYDNAGNLATTEVESYTVKPSPTPLPGLPLEALIGIVLGILTLAALTGYLLFRRKKRKRTWPYY